MTVTTSTNKTQALGNGATTSFPYSFRIYSASELVVTSTVIATGVDTILVLNTNYTVTGAGSYNGGNVVCSVAPASGTRLTIRRVLSVEQETDLRNQGAYFAETHEDVFDRHTMVDQQQQEEINRSVKFPEADASLISELPPAADRASKAIVFDEDGNITVSDDDYNDQLANVTTQAGIATAAATSATASASSATASASAAAASETAAALSAIEASVYAGNFIQAGTGAVTRTAQNKMREIVSFTDFGAVGDGVTDDTANVQEALTFGINCTIVADTNKTYLISSQLTIRSGTTIRGNDTFKLSASFPAGTAVFRNETQTGTLNSYYDTNICLDGLSFDGNNNLNRTAPMFSFAKVLNITIQNCKFSNHSYIVIESGANKNVNIVRNYFTNNGRPKPSAISAPCIWSDSGAGGTPYDLKIEHNYFLDNNWSCAYFMPTGGSFSFNICRGNGESGVFSSANGLSLRYIGNHIEGQVRSNISASGIETGASNIVISDNILSSNASDGISLTDLENAVVTNNIIFNNGQEPAYFTTASGISVITISSPNPDHIRISGNRIGDRQASKTQKYGIAVGGVGSAVDRLSVHDNDLTEQGTQGFYIASGKWGIDCYVRDNNTLTGVLQEPVKYVQFQAPAGTGAYAVTGVGFKPRSIEILATVPGAATTYQSTGFYDRTLQSAHYLAVDGAGRAASLDASLVIDIKTSAAVQQTAASVTSLDQDGFTLNFTTTTLRPWCVARCYP